ncbi:MAG TPA: GtrA family protein [Bryobacteraceae bacterium]|nr:GtrA family protein [Bryobacteraceae bacterium]
MREELVTLRVAHGASIDDPGSGRTAGLSIRGLLIEGSDDVVVQFARYTIVGAIAFLVDFSTLFLLTHFAGLYYLISAAISFPLGVAVNYALSRIWVFNRRTLSNPIVEFLVFAAIGIVGLGLTELGIWLLAGKAGLNYLAAKIVTTVIVYLWNFGARKIALFR